MFRLVLSVLLLPLGYDYARTRSPLSIPHSGSQIESHCGTVSPILKPEFDARQAALASVLHKLNASAYITEPSANSQYYANFSSVNWKLSERPLLLLIRPQHGSGGIEPEVTLLTPKVSSCQLLVALAGVKSTLYT
jgi:hypothetical protein